MPDTPLPAWAIWPGPGPEPKRWTATDPSGNAIIVYRSYRDYCDD